MKRMMTLSLLAIVGCASSAAAPRPAATAASTSCGSLAPQLIARDSDIYTRPDSTSQVVARVRSDTPVCAAVERVGFGFRMVRLADGKIGYVSDDDLVSERHSG